MPSCLAARRTKPPRVLELPIAVQRLAAPPSVDVMELGCCAAQWTLLWQEEDEEAPLLAAHASQEVLGDRGAAHAASR